MKKKIVSNSKELLQHDPSKILIAFNKEMRKENVERILEKVGLELIQIKKKNEAHYLREINHTTRRFWAKRQEGNIIDSDLFSSIKEILREKIDWIGYACINFEDFNQSEEKNRFCPLPNSFLINKKLVTSPNFEGFCNMYHLTINESKSKCLCNYSCVEINDPLIINALELKAAFQEEFGFEEMIFENMPLYKPRATNIPNDPLLSDQWNLSKINASKAWDLSAGNNSVIIAVLDDGCDLGHPDLKFSSSGVDLGTMLPNGDAKGKHGTACAGIIAATFNNNEGVSGIARNCLILPIAFENWTDVEVAAGINYAVNNGAKVINMSIGWSVWDPKIIDPEIQLAHEKNVLICAATQNYNGPIAYPASNPFVIACGASSTDDNRKSPSSPDGGGWGSNFGDLYYNSVKTGVSVVAPGVMIPTTDLLGNAGYNTALSPAGDYYNSFFGTSAATPHVAGLAALLLSEYPTLTFSKLRYIIESTAAKVGDLPYTQSLEFPNGTRNEEMGYGRIDLYRALDFADVIIKNHPNDKGKELSTCSTSDFWNFSNIVVKKTDDDLFNPYDLNESSKIRSGQDNYVYVRVHNEGPNVARNVIVNVRITPYVGLQFSYPDDWSNTDSVHIEPESLENNFDVIPAGKFSTAKFKISALQADSLLSWQKQHSWHPSILASVISDNDYAFEGLDLSTDIVTRKNNIAQKNISVIEIEPGQASIFPFILGGNSNSKNNTKLIVNRGNIPDSVKINLRINDNEVFFPKLYEPFKTDDNSNVDTVAACKDTTINLQKDPITPININETNLRIQLLNHQGGSKIQKNNIQYYTIETSKSITEIGVQPKTKYPLALEIDFPMNLESKIYSISIYQIDDRDIILGGATITYKVIDPKRDTYNDIIGD